MPQRANYSANSDEQVGLIRSAHEQESGGVGFELPTNSWISTASIIVCTMAGVGILGIPQAMENSGWSGIPLLVFCCLCNIYTGIILGKTMLRMPGNVRDYSEIGEEAFGKIGRRLAQFSIYTTLVGVSVIFLVLVGILMIGIYEKVSTGFWTLVIGILIMTPVAISLKSYGEIKIVSWFGFIATAVVVVVSVAMSLVFFGSDRYDMNNAKYHFTHAFLNVKTFSNAFNVFTFAFGATAIFPNIWVKMVHKEEWPKAVAGGYFAALLLYGPIAIVGYVVYGEYLSQFDTILGAIQFFDNSTGFILKICSGIMVAHILSAFPIIVNPVFRSIELLTIEDYKGESPLVKRLLLRTLVMMVLVIVALFFPYFLNIMSLISCISVSLSGYILPCLFYWKICKPSNAEIVLLVFVILFGLIGSGVGIVLSTQELIANVKSNPNPFHGLFHFG